MLLTLMGLFDPADLALARATLPLVLLDEFEVLVAVDANLGVRGIPDDFPAAVLDFRCTRPDCKCRERLWTRGAVVEYIQRAMK